MTPLTPIQDQTPKPPSKFTMTVAIVMLALVSAATGALIVTSSMTGDASPAPLIKTQPGDGTPSIPVPLAGPQESPTTVVPSPFVASPPTTAPSPSPVLSPAVSPTTATTRSTCHDFQPNTCPPS